MVPCSQLTLPVALLTTVALGGCSLIRSLDDYDRGTGGASSSDSTSGSSSSGVSTSGSGGGGGEGGLAGCESSLYPPAVSLVDTFDDPDPSKQNFFGCAEQVDGELRVALPDSGDFYCTSSSDLPYCLTSSSFTFQIVEAASASIPGMQTWIILRTADDTGSISLLVEGNGLQLLATVGGRSTPIPIPSSTYDPFTNIWFRLQGDAGDIVLSTSADAEAWTERGRGPALLDLDGVFLELGANRYYNETFPDSAALPAETARFDCLNAPGCR
ncbi:MAG: hypothetical protein WKG00_25350 [Polyangiaceae bacterium]